VKEKHYNDELAEVTFFSFVPFLVLIYTSVVSDEFPNSKLRHKTIRHYSVLGSKKDR